MPTPVQSLILPGWDMSHPAAAQALADLGVDIIFAPTYWLATDSEPCVERPP